MKVSRSKVVLEKYRHLKVDFSSIDLLENPRPGELKTLLSTGTYRFIADDDKKKMYVWPAIQAIHGTVAIEFKIPKSLWGEVDRKGNVSIILSDLRTEIEKWLGTDWSWTDKYGVKIEDYLKRKGFR